MVEQASLIKTTVHGRVLTLSDGEGPVLDWLVAFHGYAESAEHQLDRLRPLVDGNFGICAIQALHPFYNRQGEVVASWMTKLDRVKAIEDNIAYVDRAVAILSAKPDSPVRITYLGYSQGAAMAYRAAFKGNHRPKGIVIVGGDFPPELRGQNASGLSVLICRGKDDPHYKADQLHLDHQQLVSQNARVITLEYSGGHDWTPELLEAVANFVRGKFNG